MRKRGFTLIELLVVIAIIGVLAAILIPNILSAIAGSKKTADATNLKRLVETYLSGQAQAKAKRTPTSVGHQFWLALCVGDGPGAGNLEIQGSDDPDQYVGSGDGAGLFLSPGDQDALNQDEVKKELENAVQAGSGVGGLQNTDLMCSYAGPAMPRKNMRDKKGLIVGCTTDRGGASIFDDGFNGVTASAQARYYNYRDMVDQYNWPDGVEAPQFGSDPLTDVVK
jgi:prepilin-type N-terminal cleavage/methylation domain-containing protein